MTKMFNRQEEVSPIGTSRFWALCFAGLSLFGICATAALNYPTRPITAVVSLPVVGPAEAPSLWQLK